MVGQMLGRYLIEARLGEGGMGVVYRARDIRLERTVALKLLRERFRNDETAWGRMLSEARIASALNHPNICTVYEVGEEDDQAYISMEYVEGKPLSSLVSGSGLPYEEVLRYGVQITDALAHAHERGVVHRDIKSSNIVITPDGRAKVLDFGLAKRLPPEELQKMVSSLVPRTEAGVVTGTLAYLAPEVLRGRPANVTSDIWALGVVLYEMMTGELPFKGATAFELSLAIMTEPPKPFPPEASAVVGAIAYRCLKRDPRKRYQEAREVLADLKAERAPSSAGVASVLALPQRARLATTGGLLLAAALAFLTPPVRHFIIRAPSQTALAGPSPPTLSTSRFLVVLPFRVSGSQAALNYVAGGLTESLSAKLSQLEGLQLASGEAVAKAGKNKSIEKLGPELGVNVAVQGTVQQEGNRIRAVVSVDDLAAKQQISSRAFMGSPENLFPLEDQIFKEVTGSLRLKPSKEEQARALARPTEQVEAYDLYLKGREALRSSYEGLNNIQAAVDSFQHATEKDSGFALAYAGLADASLEMYNHKKGSFWAEKAEHSAREAVRLDDSAAEAHFALGSVYYSTGDPAKAITELKRALELAPRSDEGYRRLGSAYMANNQKDLAIEADERAIRLNPYYPGNHHVLGYTYLDLGQPAKAMESFRRVVQLDPESAAGYDDLGLGYLRQGQWSESIPQFEKSLSLEPSAGTYSNLGLAYFYLKDYAQAARMFEKAVAMSPNDQIFVGNLADAYRWSGRLKDAQPLYDKAIGLAYKDLQVDPQDATAMGSLALYYAKKGDSKKAADYINAARHIDRSTVELIYIEAVVDALGGRPVNALRLLRQAFEKGYPPGEAQNDPELTIVKSQPDFRDLVQEFRGKPG